VDGPGTPIAGDDTGSTGSIAGGGTLGDAISGSDTDSDGRSAAVWLPQAAVSTTVIKRGSMIARVGARG